jgi:acyl carrier protein
METIDSHIKRLIARNLCMRVEDVQDHKTLADLGADSLDLIELVIDVESTFDIAIDETQLSEERTPVADFTAAVIRIKEVA